MRQLAAILRKELKDTLRDRRSLFAALLLPVMVGALTFVIFGSRARDGRQGVTLSIAIAGTERAPSLITFLRQQGATVEAAPPDYENRIRAGSLDAVLIVPERYGDEFVSARPARLQLVADYSRTSSLTTATRIGTAIRAYSGQVAGLRLLARGISPDIAEPVDIQELDLSTQKSRSATLLSMVPIYLLVAICIAGLYAAVDSTAGERERGSLESLLLNPVPRQTLVSGKWLAVATFTVSGFVITLASVLLALNLIPLEQAGISMGLGLREVGLLVLIAVPLGLFVSALELMLATFARTVREGQTYLSIVPLVAFLPGLVMEANHVNAAFWMSFVPFLSQHILFSSLMRGETGLLSGLVMAAAVSVGLTLACLKSTARLLRDETIVLTH
jgi:sodium transport system permease protein